MIANFEPTKPDDIKFTLHITMTLKEWKSLSSQMSDKNPMASPTWDIRRLIEEMVDQADKHFYPKL